MSQYSKPKMIAKNLPSGSYAAGCPVNDAGKLCLILVASKGCKRCERSK